MSLDQWSAIAQILAAFVGIPSLIFVGVQLYLATKAVRAASSQAHSATYRDLSASIFENPQGFAAIFEAGIQGTDGMSAEERNRFFAFVSSLLRFFESARIQWRRGQLYREHWRAVEQQAIYLAAQPGVREFWTERRHWHCLEFEAWFSYLIDRSSANHCDVADLKGWSAFDHSEETKCVRGQSAFSLRRSKGAAQQAGAERR